MSTRVGSLAPGSKRDQNLVAVLSWVLREGEKKVLVWGPKWASSVDQYFGQQKLDMFESASSACTAQNGSRSSAPFFVTTSRRHCRRFGENWWKTKIVTGLEIEEGRCKSSWAVFFFADLLQ